MIIITITCEHCQKQVQRRKIVVDHRLKKGSHLFCSIKCSAQYRKKYLPDEEKKRLKSEYDAKRRIELADRLKIEKAAYHKRTYDPVAAAEHRKTRMPYHVEYCRRPEYKKRKQKYDQEHRMKLRYGEFWESAILVNEIEKEYDARQANQDNNTYNKSIKRKRAWLLRQKTDLVRST